MPNNKTHNNKFEGPKIPRIIQVRMIRAYGMAGATARQTSQGGTGLLTTKNVYIYVE